MQSLYIVSATQNYPSTTTWFVKTHNLLEAFSWALRFTKPYWKMGTIEISLWNPEPKELNTNLVRMYHTTYRCTSPKDGQVIEYADGSGWRITNKFKN